MTYAEHVPVLVIGGGPVGLSTALELHLHGIAVTVIEPRVVVDHRTPRAKTTSARTMEHFRRWGIADRVRERAGIPLAWSRRVSFCTTVTGHEVAAIDDVLGLAYADTDLVAEPAQQVTQPVIEEVLRERVAELDDVNLLLGWRAIDIESTASSALVTIEDEQGERRNVSADWVIGADGARSLVRAAMGARFEGAAAGRPNVNITFRSRQLAGRVRLPPSIHYWVLNPEAPGVVGPVDLHGTWWAIATGTESISSDDEAVGIVRRLTGAADLDVDVLATDPWQARLLLADRYRNGRLFVVGDAAHQNPPWGGHGFNTGVGDAVNLGWKLAAVIRGWAPGGLLDSYETERRPIAQQTIDVAAANMRSLPIELADSALMAEGQEADCARARAADAIAVTKDSEFHADGLVLGYGYTPAAREQSSSLGTYRPITAPGNRLPHRRLADGESLYDALGNELTAIGPAAGLEALSRTARTRSIPLAVIENDGEVLVVRPDQHIGWVGETVTDPDAVFDRVLRGFGSGS